MFISSRSKRWHLDWLIAMPLGLVLCWALAAAAQPPAAAPQSPSQQPATPQQADVQQGMAQPATHHVQSPNERMEMIVNTSRIVTLSEPIPKLAVNNPDVLTVTPLSPNEVQVSAKKTGVTQINLWSQSGKIYTLDVMVIGDARELAMILRSRFPNATLNVLPLPNSVIISGNVDDATQVNQIVDIAEDFYPKVHNQIIVGGVQQVLLQVRVMEVSRSKLRSLGVDFGDLARNGSFIASGPSGLLKMAQVPISTAPLATAVTGGAETLSFGVLGSGNEFFAFLNALRTDGLARVLAEPNLVTVSGRPAYFNVGGQIPVPIPQSLGTISIQYKPYGTQVDFVPIVLGNGAIRLEVRPSISEIDTSLSVPINGTNVPALVVREIDTGVEMRPGQTLAIAGLVQNRVESTKTGIPWISDMPYIGALFRKNTEQTNEVELLILVTPQLIEAMDPHEVPPCGPGMNTTTATDHEFYLKGYLEVPNLCNPGAAPWPAGASQVSVGPPGPGPGVVPDAGAPPGSMSQPGMGSQPGFGPQPVYVPQPGFGPQGEYVPPQALTPQPRVAPPPPAVSGPAPGSSSSSISDPTSIMIPARTSTPLGASPQPPVWKSAPVATRTPDAAPAAQNQSTISISGSDSTPPTDSTPTPSSFPVAASAPTTSLGLNSQSSAAAAPISAAAPVAPVVDDAAAQAVVSQPTDAPGTGSQPLPPTGPAPTAPQVPSPDKGSSFRLQPPADARVRYAMPSAPVVRPASEKPASRPATTISYDSPNPDNRYQRQNPSTNGAAKTPPTPGFIGPLGYDVVQ